MEDYMYSTGKWVDVAENKNKQTVWRNSHQLLNDWEEQLPYSHCARA